MLFNSFGFIFIFLPLVFAGYFLLNRFQKTKMALMFLSISSLLFYSIWYPPYLLIILASIGFNYLIGLAILKTQDGLRKSLLTIGIISNLGLLGFYKYADFFIENVNGLLENNIALLNVALPLAISFFTFQQISYLVDLYKKQVKTNNFFSYILYVSFFPQLIAGPIVHHSEMMPQFEDEERKRINLHNVSLGLFVFMIGLTKKVVIADTLAIWANDGFANYALLSPFEAWITALAYTFQLYFDFSGYCDMAIGIALLFNIKLPINFFSPYKARNIADFWRSWHMTLNVFLTQYLYIPLGGSRKGKIRTYINLFLVFFLSGIWHGAGWTFIIWGALHGIASIIVKLWSKLNIKLPFLLSWMMTFLFVNFAWVYFRAEEVKQANAIIKQMLNLKDTGIFSFVKGQTQVFTEAANLQVLGLFLNNPILIISFILMSFTISVSMKNSIQLMQNWKPNVKTMLHFQLMLIVILLVLFYFQKTSEFLYFNF